MAAHLPLVPSDGTIFEAKDWAACFASQRLEFDYWVEIEGKVPPTLTGTLFRNGPGVFSAPLAAGCPAHERGQAWRALTWLPARMQGPAAQHLSCLEALPTRARRQRCAGTSQGLPMTPGRLQSAEDSHMRTGWTGTGTWSASPLQVGCLLEAAAACGPPICLPGAHRRPGR